MDKVLRNKEEKLHALLREYGRLAVAFSAGVDSTYLLMTAHDVLGERVLAITARTVSVPQRDTEEAAAYCAMNGIRHITLDLDQMAVPAFAQNLPDRCYHCKKALFSAFSETARNMGFPVLAEGTNADDAPDDRPGMRALAELGVRSPLREAGLFKQEIRDLSRKAGLATWNKPSAACLATRIPFGETITPQKLQVVDIAEQYLRDAGFRQVRVRLHGVIARIEIEPEQFDRITEPEMREEILQAFTKMGFGYVTLDLAGFRSGSMNITKE